MERKRLKTAIKKPGPSKEELIARFKGKTRKGSKNKFTHVVKDALLQGVARVGADGRGKRGLVGYWETIAREYPELTAKLLAKTMPIDMRMTELAAQLSQPNNQQQNAPQPLTLNFNAIRGMTDDELRIASNALSRMIPTHRALGRLDKPAHPSVVDVEYDDKE